MPRDFATTLQLVSETTKKKKKRKEKKVEDIVAHNAVGRFGLAARRQATTQTDVGSSPLWFSFLFKACG